MDTVSFSGRVRYWDPDKGAGLAVVDIPEDGIAALGGLKQQKVHGTVNGAEFSSNVMPAGGGRLAMGCSKALLKSAHAEVGDEIDVSISRVGVTDGQ
jgi:hypothetical protein